MEKASGELNLTVITIVAIAAIAAFFYAFVWPAMRDSISTSQQCANAICPCEPSEGQTINCSGCMLPDGTTRSCRLRG
jgi:hypothetical protein